MRCSECKWFHKQTAGSSELGQCRKYAPSPGGFATDITNWPRTHVYDFCGEFEAPGPAVASACVSCKCGDDKVPYDPAKDDTIYK